MNPAYQKIYTCTPVAFHANDGFFIRDTGLISNGLRELGVESKCIMPLPYYEDDQRDHLLRTEYANLESVEWWKSLKLDALVLYSWGAPRYRRIARAVRRAGIRLVLHMDTNGDFVGAFADNAPLWPKLKRWMQTKAQDVFRAQHMRCADVITMCPTVAEAVSRLPFYGYWVVERCFPMPCPVSPACAYDGRAKEDIILCVGRWDDVFQKRPEMLMSTLEAYYAQGGEAETRIFGTITEAISTWHASLAPQVAARIRLAGYTPNHLLREEYQTARVVLCPSRYESSHIVSAEALCCGCSVVVPDRAEELRDVHWYTTRESGTIAAGDTPRALAEALTYELEQWHAGKRRPAAIAAAWQPHFHVDKVFNQIFE